MSTNQVSPQQSGGSSGDQGVDSASQPCPLTECAALIYCLDGRNFAIKDVQASVTNGPGPKNTDEQGSAEFEHLKPPNTNYTATVTLTGDNLKKYCWRDADTASTSFTQYIAGADEELFKFKVICLAYPSVKVLWEADNSAIASVGVRLQQLATDKYTLPDTTGEGLSKLADTDTGVKPGDYSVAFPTGIEDCLVVDARTITIDEASKATFTFHVRKFKVWFTLKDQFGQDVPSPDWVLYYPGGAKKDNGTLGSEANGKVEKDKVPDGTYTFCVKHIYGPSWGSESLGIGTDVTLTVNATGFDPDADVKFEIFDSCVPSGDALDTVTGKIGADLNDPSVTVSWKPDAEKLKKVTSGAVVFIASVGAKKATSGAASIVGEQEFDVKDAGGSPLVTSVNFSFSTGGEVVTQTVTSTDGKAKPKIPLGAVMLSVQLAGQEGIQGKFTGTDSTQNFINPAD